MRIAFISAVKQTPDGDICAFLPYLDRTVLAAQYDLALDLGVQRIVCLSAAQTPEILALQQEAERNGIDFHFISRHSSLVGLIAADHELIVIEDGLLLDRDIIAPVPQSNSSQAGVTAKARGIATVPAIVGVSLGFERIDADNAWAGILIARADIAAKLADLPADSAPASLLLRLALQAKTPLISLGEEQLSNGGVLRVENAEVLSKREKRVLQSVAVEQSWAGPGNTLAQKIVDVFLFGGRGSGALRSGAMVTAIIGAFFTMLGLALTGLSYANFGAAALVVSALFLAMYASFDAVTMGLARVTSDRNISLYISRLFDTSIAIFLILMLARTVPWAEYGLTSVLWSMIAIGPIAIGMVNIAAGYARNEGQKAWRSFWNDRVVLTAILGLATVFEALPFAVSGIAIFAIGFTYISGKKTRLR